jgi:hypothetical protein
VSVKPIFMNDVGVSIPDLPQQPGDFGAPSFHPNTVERLVRAPITKTGVATPSGIVGKLTSG